VPRLGAKAFEQSAGFLRVRGGAHPLDASPCTPSATRSSSASPRDLGVDVAHLVGNEPAVRRWSRRATVRRGRAADAAGHPRRAAEAGRDPRAAFERPAFRDDITEPKDLSRGWCSRAW
jgi:uncharacterized protein